MICMAEGGQKKELHNKLLDTMSRGGNFSEGMYDTAMSRDWRTHGKENIYYGGRIGKMPESGGYLCRI